MLGQMMDRPLMISSIIEFAADVHGDQTVVSVTGDNPHHVYTYRDAHARMKRLANALIVLGVKPGDRVATLAWNDHRHFELYYAVSGIGAVIHTINPRLFVDQLVYIFNHAADEVLFIEPLFLPLIDKVADKLTALKKIVVMTDRAHMPEGRDELLCYEDLMAAAAAEFDWPEFDENTACGLCYTSGTTGNPKGTLYSHRSTLLHALACNQPNVVNLSSADVVLPVVPMFHVNAWGIPYMAPLAGAGLVLPGAGLDGASLVDRFEEDRVTYTAGVPTIWFALLQYLRESGRTLTHLKRLIVGGAAPPRSMIKTFEEEYGLYVQQGWGMTEMSPIGSCTGSPAAQPDLPHEQLLDLKAKAGRAFWGCELRLVDDQMTVLPHNGETTGHLQVRGPWVTSGYYEDSAANRNAFSDDGWFYTGDVGSIDEHGYLTITDRSKDMIKSGGEWISSIDLENAVMGHPDVAEAAAIAISDEKWGERPLLAIVARADSAPTAEDIRSYLAERVAKWWLPEAIEFLDQLPHTATGKVMKRELRERFKNHRPKT